MAQHHLIMENKQFLKMNNKLPTESNKLGDSSNYQTDSMSNNSFKTGTNLIDLKLHKNNSDKFWQLSDLICLKNKTEPFVNYMLQMTKNNRK